ncbi:MAG: hypothetical protein ACRCWJ_21120, partial [Casimicrobium sp.]
MSAYEPRNASKGFLKSRFMVKRMKSWIKCSAAVVAVIGFSHAGFAAPGSADPTFGNGLGVTDYRPDETAGWANKAVIDLQGRLVMAGVCGYNSEYFLCALRLNTNGQLDASFGTGGVVRVVKGEANAVAVDEEGRVLVGGHCIELNDARIGCLARLSDSGALDSSFSPSGNPVGVRRYASQVASSVLGIHLVSGSKMLITASCQYGTCISRYLSSGATDQTFYPQSTTNVRALQFAQPIGNVGLRSLKVAQDGKLVGFGVCGGGMCVVRLTQDGVTDTAFRSDAGSIGAVPISFSTAQEPQVSSSGFYGAIDSLGRIYVVGDCDAYRWACVSRLNANGTLDTTFGNDSTRPGRLVLRRQWQPNGYPELSTYFSIVLDFQGRIVLSGGCAYSVSQMCVTRLLSDGTLDTSFDAEPGNGNGIVSIASPSFFSGAWANTAAIDGAGRLYLAGKCYNFFGSDPFCATRIIGGDVDRRSCTLNADANNTIAASSDAMLATRYLFGFQGEALTTGVIGQNAARTADEIVTYLDSLKNDPLRKLDLDGDGQSLALTDGLLMLRAMLGLSGDALTT